MEYKKLGNTELEAPPIIFGGNVFGWTVNEKDSFRLMDKLLERGINMIDSANVYSRWAKGNKGGESETIIGKYIKQRKNRGKLTIATKVGSSMIQGGPKNISKKHILTAIEESLKRLQTNYIDLYFTHWDDDTTPVEETLSGYQELIEQGKIRYIGASNLLPERLKASLLASKKTGLPKYEVFQPEYSLAERSKFEGKIREFCEEFGLGVTSYFSLASGFLTGKYRNVEDIKGTDREVFLKNYFDDRGKRILDALNQTSRKHGVSQAAIALGWVMNRPGITAPIASVTTESQLKSFDEALNLKLDNEDMEKLNIASAY